MNIIVQNVFVFLSIALSTNQCRATRPDFTGNTIPEIRIQELGGDVTVRNGDMLNCAANGIVGGVIRKFSDGNSIPNPLGYSHSALAVLEYPRWVHELILKKTPNEENKGQNCTIPEEAGNYMREALELCYGNDIRLAGGGKSVLRAFTIEASGTATMVLRGGGPCALLLPFIGWLANYDGSVYQRHVYLNIQSELSRQFYEEHIGRSYEGLGTLSELVRAVKGRNNEENTTRVFCSELAGLFYRRVIETYCRGEDSFEQMLRRYRNVSNLIPELYCSQLGDRDLLHGIAGPEIVLKEYKKHCILL
ncbi:MAG: hypothetical protein LBB25_02110 [Holosporaceae bacterium]|nr:hypothetical protein [Holosporaceae bacterium]